VLAEQDKFQAPQDILVEPLNSLYGHYDYILLDTAPNATIPTVAAYKAADFIILSALPEPWAVEGLADALRDIQAAQRRGNDKLKLLGVCLSSVDKRTRLSAMLAEYVHRAGGTEGPQDGLSGRSESPRCRAVSRARTRNRSPNRGADR
jgi:chromosome partitioning protein